MHLLVYFFGRETWSLTLRKEGRLRVHGKFILGPLHRVGVEGVADLMKTVLGYEVINYYRLST